MLMQEPTEELIKECKEIYNKNKDNLTPNKKEGLEIIEYLKNKYSVIEIQNKKLENIDFQTKVIEFNEYKKSEDCDTNKVIQKNQELLDEYIFILKNEYLKVEE